MTLMVSDAAAPALGVLVTMMIAILGSMIALAMPFIAEGFIYIGILDLLPQALVRSGPGAAISLTGAGFASMALLSLLH